MTGSNNYLVRFGFTQSDEWRKALGNAEPLLACADTGYCLDAPLYLPAGAMQSSKHGPMNQTVCRNVLDQ